MSDTKQVLNFVAYSVGLCCASICTSLPLDETTKRLNSECPTGVGPWEKANEGFRTGETNPCPCNENPETHKHYLFIC
ncbi:hypothetical protein LCGC14_2681600 [marine sediment metagenome]|uniref:Uncharacterized protein n=1 Tax=marine sediment metagenome TaxID=412755 RepID=A0A0F8ZL82_9ZZZZ